MSLHIRVVLLVNLLMLSAGGVATAQQQALLDGWFSWNTWRPSSTPGEGMILERADVLPHLRLGSAIALQGDRRPLEVQRRDGDGWTRAQDIVRSPFLFHLSSHLGLFKYAQLGIHLPLYADNGTGREKTGGAGDLRIVAKGAHRFTVGSVELGAGIQMAVSAPTGNPFYFTGEPGATVEALALADADFGRVRPFANIGVLGRKKETRYGLTTGSDLLLALGADVRPVASNERFLVTGAVRASIPAGHFAVNAMPVELHAGASYRFRTDIFLGAAFGTGLSPGIGAPPFRFMLEVGFVAPTFARQSAAQQSAAKAADRDRDSIPDADDLCLDDAEDYDGFKDDDGCPEPDNDGDGVSDVRDRCPLEPGNAGETTDGCPTDDPDGDRVPAASDLCPTAKEDLDGFNDHDGCPDDDNDGDGVSDAQDRCPFHPELRAEIAADAAANDEAATSEATGSAPAPRDGCPDTFTIEEGRVVPKVPVAFVPFKVLLQGDASLFFDELVRMLLFRRDWKEIGRAHV